MTAPSDAIGPCLVISQSGCALQSVQPPADGPVMPFMSTGAERDPSARGGIDTEGVAKDAKSAAGEASEQAQSTAEGASKKAQSAAKDAQSRVTK